MLLHATGMTILALYRGTKNIFLLKLTEEILPSLNTLIIVFSSEKIIEPIQSRCAMLRYSKLSDAQVLANLLTVCDKENVAYSDDGMEAIVFTAQGSYLFLVCL